MIIAQSSLQPQPERGSLCEVWRAHAVSGSLQSTTGLETASFPSGVYLVVLRREGGRKSLAGKGSRREVSGNERRIGPPIPRERACPLCACPASTMAPACNPVPCGPVDWDSDEPSNAVSQACQRCFLDLLSSSHTLLIYSIVPACFITREHRQVLTYMSPLDCLARLADNGDYVCRSTPLFGGDSRYGHDTRGWMQILHS